MESLHTLPFRTEETRSLQNWPAPSQTGHTIVSTGEHYQAQLPQYHQQHQYQSFGSVQQQHASALQHGYYATIQAAPQMVSSPLSPNNAQYTYPFQQSFPMIADPSLATTPVQARHSILPAPSQILLSQKGSCLACGKQNCQLVSHRHFARHALSTAKQSIRTSEMTSRPVTAIHEPLVRALPVTPKPIVLDSERDHMLALWSTEWSPVKRGPERHLFPSKFIDTILPAAQAHAPLLHALLAYSGTLWSLANSVTSDVAGRQTAVAVEMLSHVCPTEAEASTDEAMLAATLLLLVYMAQGNGFETGKHVSGLIHLTNLRGGLHYLGLSGLVAETLIHADHMQAIYFNRKPIWQSILPPLDIGLPPRLGAGFRRALSNQEIDSTLAIAAISVCRVADILAHVSTDVPLPKEAKYGFGYVASIAEHQLAHCNAVYHGSATANECMCLALILFNHIVLFNDGATTPSILQVEYRFWQAIEGAEAKGSTLELMPALYVWMVITAMTVCTRGDSQYRSAGIQRLRATMIGAGIATWDDLKHKVLEDYVWLASGQEDAFLSIWAEVEGTKSKTTSGTMAGARILLFGGRPGHRQSGG